VHRSFTETGNPFRKKLMRLDVIAHHPIRLSNMLLRRHREKSSRLPRLQQFTRIFMFSALLFLSMRLFFVIEKQILF
jgi:hypothetical protein